MSGRSEWIVRQARPEDIPEIVRLCRAVYPTSRPWREAQLESHQRLFPEGQLVAVRRATGELVGSAASLIVFWNDYGLSTTWRDFTGGGYFTNHDPLHGRTLYGAEVMVDPALQGRRIGRALYAERRELVRRLSLLRIRAGARLRGYHRHAATLTPEEYVEQVVRGELRDPTLSFQLSEGFQVLAVVPEYLHHDPESLGCAALIEWLNPDLATPADAGQGDPRFRPTPPDHSPTK